MVKLLQFHSANANLFIDIRYTSMICVLHTRPMIYKGMLTNSEIQKVIKSVTNVKKRLQ